MAKTAGAKVAFRCGECGVSTPKWVGRCPECQAWGTVEEVGGAALTVVTPGRVSAPAQRIGDIDADAAARTSTGVPEFDRVLGGGLVAGAVLLLAGEPGVGKSTLLLEVAARSASADTPVLVVTGEESASQVRLRAERIGAVHHHVYLAAETDLAAVLAQIDAVQPSLVVLDSVQTISCADVDGSAGSVTQVRTVASALIRVAKERGIAVVLVGHVTKDGSIAGPRVLEHLVDVVLQFEGERHGALRIVRAVKNRYGAADEIGCFEITDSGLVGLADPSALFLSRRDIPVSGTAVTVTLEGRRPLVAEVQALVATTQAPSPRRATSGLDSSRLAMIVAVLSRRAVIALHDREVYAATVGGVRLNEPAGDLAVAMAIGGSHLDRTVPAGTVVLGEVGLSGELRRVSGTARRLAEAARHGFTHAIVPAGSGPYPRELTVVEVRDVREALTKLKDPPVDITPIDVRFGTPPRPPYEPHRPA